MSTALPVMDVQQNILSRDANDATYLARVRRAIDAARRAKIRVVYVTVSFRPGYPEVSVRNKSFAAVTQGGGFVTGEAATAVPPEIAPAAGEVDAEVHRVLTEKVFRRQADVLSVDQWVEQLARS